MGRARGPPYHVPFRRRREGKTDYRRRLKLLLSKKYRVIVRKSNRYIRMQLVSNDRFGDKTLVSALSSELPKYGYDSGKCNCPTAYLTGLLFGKRAKEAGFDDGILDIGLNTPVHGSNIFAALEGAIDSGLAIPHDPAVFPTDDRISGTHIATFLQKPDIINNFHTAKDKIVSEKKMEKEKEEESTTG
jgi:large subunit ribosomal protein L18